MLCNKCGANVKDGDSFCSVCGTSVKGNYGVQNNTQNPTPPVKKKSNAGIFVALGIVGALALALIAVIVIVVIIIIAANSDSHSVSYSAGQGIGIVEMPQSQNRETSVSIQNEEKEETDGDFLYPSDKKIITFSELDEYTKEEIALIRNEIYARRGYIFQLQEYARYFESKDWYTPNPNFNEAMFSEIEKANKDIIVEYETRKGWR